MTDSLVQELVTGPPVHVRLLLLGTADLRAAAVRRLVSRPILVHNILLV